MRQKTCSACGGKMQSLGNMELQKGKFSMLFGHWVLVNPPDAVRAIHPAGLW